MTPDPHVAKAERDVARWSENLEQLERGRKVMNRAMIAGIVAAGLTLALDRRIAMAVAALTLVLGLMTVYFTAVRKTEFQDQLRDAQRRLAAARRDQPRAPIEPHRDPGTDLMPPL